MIEAANPNPPIFVAPFYEFILYENAPVGQLMGRVNAQNKFGENQNNSIIYSLSAEAEQMPFEIEPTNGTIYTKSTIYKNYKRYGYEFYAVATSTLNTRDNSSVKVKVKILDINDQVPEFSQAVYHVNISEETTVGLPLLTLSINSVNKEAHSHLEYSIESGNENNVFALVRQGGSKAFLATQRSNLNYKRKPKYELLVKVMDQDGLYSTAIIHVSITPADLYTPRFTQSVYKFQVYENAPVDSLVGAIQAQIPAGTADGAKLTYKIMTVDAASDNSGLDFSLDDSTGMLYVANVLDREKSDAVTLYVTASLSPQLIDHAIVQLELLDINDNEPVFTRSSYHLDVYEDDNVGSYLLRVEANDKDLNRNSMVRYSIKEENDFLRIDPSTGVIQLTKKLAQNSLNLTLIAADMGAPSLSAEVNIHVQCMHAAHLAPQFDRAVIHFYLLENHPINTVVGEIRARDPDLGSHANIVYKILGATDLFELRPSGSYNSALLVARFVGDFDVKSGNLFMLTVRAYASATAANVYTDCSIHVHVRNLNNYEPQVPARFRIIFNNYKNYFLTENSAYVPVYAADESTNLTFSLADAVGKQMVDLDAMTGKITFKPILNSNNLINVSFLIGIDGKQSPSMMNSNNLFITICLIICSTEDGMHQMKTTCELNVLMLSDNLIAESVTLSFSNMDTVTFLDFLYQNFTNTLFTIMPNFKQVYKALKLTIFISTYLI